MQDLKDASSPSIYPSTVRNGLSERVATRKEEKRGEKAEVSQRTGLKKSV